MTTTTPSRTSVTTKARRVLDARRAQTEPVRRAVRRAALESVLLPRRLRGLGSNPDFVVAGAQRCGTTSLFVALGVHRQIPDLPLGMKGVHYFDTAYDRPVAWYRAHFPTDAERTAAAAAGSPLRAGEASPYYLFHPTALERLAGDVPDVRVVLMLRDPVKRAISHHRHMVWEGHEPITDIGAALAAEPTRLAGAEAHLRSGRGAASRPHQHFSYLARSRYAPQVRRALELFGDRLLVVISEELFAETGAGLQRITDFLGLDSSVPLTLGRENSSPGAPLSRETLQWMHDQVDESTAELEDLLGRRLPWPRRHDLDSA